MSKDNGRKSNRGQGNDMDKFNGICNGVKSNYREINNEYSNQSRPSSLDSKASNYRYPNHNTDKNIRKFKNKIK